MKKLLFIVLSFLFFSVALAQTDLITEIGPVSGSGSPPPTANQINPITVNFDALKTGPELLDITLLDDSTITVSLKYFRARAGYSYFDEDVDPPGTPPIHTNSGFTR